jgi:hypothetical protein
MEDKVSVLVREMGTTDEELAAVLECTVDDLHEVLLGPESLSRVQVDALTWKYGAGAAAKCMLLNARESDIRKLGHLNTLFTIASDMAEMWEADRSEYADMSAEVRAIYFRHISNMFWEIAGEIRLCLSVELLDEDEEVDMRAYLNTYNAVLQPNLTCGWVIKVGREYRLYKDESAALQAAYDLTYARSEYDVQFYFDELDPYSWEMGSAVDYLESKGLGKGRTGNREGITVLHTISGLKEELGQDGWVNFLMSFGYGYTVHPAIPT